MFVVDTNVLLHAVNDASLHHGKARSVLGEWLTGPHPVHLTWGIVYEFLRVSTHREVFPRPLTFEQAAAFLDALLSNPRVEVLVETDGHAERLAAAAREMPALAGSRFHDLHTALLMREHGLSDVRTEDADFHRFAGIRPTNPFARA